MAPLQESGFTSQYALEVNNGNEQIRRSIEEPDRKLVQILNLRRTEEEIDEFDIPGGE